MRRHCPPRSLSLQRPATHAPRSPPNRLRPLPGGAPGRNTCQVERQAAPSGTRRRWLCFVSHESVRHETKSAANDGGLPMSAADVCHWMLCFKVLQGDITQQKVDAIVNAANSTLLGSPGALTNTSSSACRSTGFSRTRMDA